MDQITKLTIDRSKWARRGLNGYSQLLNSKGAMCCLGFYTKACGATDQQLRGIPGPASLKDSGVAVPAWLVAELPDQSPGGSWHSPSTEARRLMDENDGTETTTTEAELEAFITTTFAKHGVEVTFIDGVAAPGAFVGGDTYSVEEEAEVFA